MSCPSTVILPSVGLTIPQITLISVVFPAPLGPSNAKISPRRMSRSIPLSAWNPEAKVLESFETEMMGCFESAIMAYSPTYVMVKAKIHITDEHQTIMTDGRDIPIQS